MKPAPPVISMLCTAVSQTAIRGPLCKSGHQVFASHAIASDAKVLFGGAGSGALSFAVARGHEVEVIDESFEDPLARFRGRLLLRQLLGVVAGVELQLRI